jgi:hypothetical protein
VTLVARAVDSVTGQGIPNARVFVSRYGYDVLARDATDTDGYARLSWDLNQSESAEELVVTAEEYDWGYKSLLDSNGDGLSEDRCDPPIVVTLEKKANSPRAQSPPSAGQLR